MQSNVMPNFLKKRAFLTPDRIAVYFENQTLTFKELYRSSAKTAGQLQGHGIQKDQFVGILLKNQLDTVIILLALQLLGVRAVILNNRLTPSELAWQLEDSKASSVIVDDSFSELLAFFQGQQPSLSGMTVKQVFISNPKEADILEEVNLAEICTIMYTSGTTGYPKGVIQTYGNHWWSAVGSALNLGLSEHDSWLCSVPIFHISGYSILMKSIIYGMPMVLHKKFDAKKALADIKEKRITIMSVVGTMLTEMVELLGKEQQLPDYFRCFLLGGGPAPLPLLQACVEKGAPVFQTYGMTETSSQIVTLSPEYSMVKLGSAGKPLFPSEIKIEVERGRVAAPGQAGEIVVRGPNVTSGYLFRSDVTMEKIRDGWLYTGDIGYMDDEGFLYVLDRRSDLIISGGENIYPAEVEGIILSHPGVSEAGVIGIEDDKWGQVPVAVAVRRDDQLSEEELREFCQERLAKYKVPKAVYFVEKLPRNASKKLLRRELREWLNEGRIHHEHSEN
ncbi:o-succinylbenzoate--CoA ligase [Bacillus sp. JJ1764]|uniref:o-succinylbenzoate--CoA ligase n=1 Tax=Bacillus sp. JJ1764 TaxID=3122964 RepID=UPI0030009E77